MSRVKHHMSTPLLWAALMGTALSSCAVSSTRLAPNEVSYPIEIAESIERLELYTRANGLELSRRDQDAVMEFLADYRASGDGPIYMNIPSNAASGQGVQQADALIRQGLARVGANPAAVQMGQYQVAQSAPAPVVISYRQLKVMPRDCQFMDALTFTGTNQVSQSYGCSQSANLAAMVQDPRQFLEPRAMPAPDSKRRMVVYDKYINGENTASTQPVRQEISAQTSE